MVCSASQITHVFLRKFTMNFPLKNPPGLALFSTESKFLMLCGTQVLQLCPTLCNPWTVAHQTPPSTGFSRQEYWSGLPCPPPVDLPDPGVDPGSPALQVDSSLSEPPGKPHALWEHVKRQCWG